MISTTTQLELSPGIQIVEFDTSTQEKSYRVELSDGRQFQINEKLYQLLNCLYRPMPLSKLTEAFQQRTGEVVAMEQLQELSVQLTEQGVITLDAQTPEPSNASTEEDNSYLGLHFRRDLFSSGTLAPITQRLQIFFTLPVAIPAIMILIGVHAYVFAQHGFPPNLDMTAINWPLFQLLLLVSIFVHELGHLSACCLWQCPHGALGVGLYFFNPVFYADVSPAWRLSRWQRVIVNMGGLYLQLLFNSVWLILFIATQNVTYLFVIFVTNVEILTQFSPFMKLDGYWLLADLTGVPNLHARTGATLKYGWAWLLWRLRIRSVKPTLSTFNQLTPWVQYVVSIYTILSMVIWPLLLIMIVPVLVEIIATYPTMWGAALRVLAVAVVTGNASAFLTQLGILFLPTIFVLNLGLLLTLTWRRFQKRRIEKTQSKVVNSM